MKILGLFTALVFCFPVTVLANETVIIAEPNNITDKATIVQVAEKAEKIDLLESLAKKTSEKETADSIINNSRQNIVSNEVNGEEVLHTESDELKAVRNISFAAVNPCRAEAVAAFKEANKYFQAAKLSENASEKSVNFAEAVKFINEALQLEPDNYDFAVLASQIYRGKGGISYAKSYFQRAERILGENLKIYPDSIDTNLDYALVCAAGDMRYTSEYADYQKKAKLAAEKVLDLCEQWYKDNDKSAKSLNAEAMAELILGHKEKCTELLLEAKNISAEKTENTLSLYDVYRETVLQNKWLWKVSAESLDKEFMLYYLKNTERYK